MTLRPQIIFRAHVLSGRFSGRNPTGPVCLSFQKFVPVVAAGVSLFSASPGSTRLLEACWRPSVSVSSLRLRM